MIENTELIIKGNKLVQRKTLDMPLEDSENIFKQFIHRQQSPQYAPCSTNFWADSPNNQNLVEKSWVLSKDFSEGYGAVHKVKQFPISGVYGFKIENKHENEYMPRSYYFGYEELVDYEACSINYIAGHGYDSDTEFLAKIKDDFPDNFVAFPSNQVFWSDPRFDLFIANFTPENHKVYFFAIEKEYIVSGDEADDRSSNKQFPMYAPLAVSLPNLYDTGQVCMGYEYDEISNQYDKHDKQSFVLSTFANTTSNRDLDHSGTFPHLTFNVRGKPIPLHNRTMFKDSYDDVMLGDRAPFRPITNSFILQFSELYKNGTLI